MKEKIINSIRISIITVLLLSFQLALFSQEVDYSALKSEVTEYIEKEIKKKKITGLSITLVDDQETVWTEGFGYAIKSAKKEADENTVYRIGSVSKLFTATAIMQLVEDGKIDLDKAIDAYIPGFKVQSHFENPGPITVRSLLTHESGLPSDYFYNFFFDNPPPGDYAKEYRKLPEQIKDEYVATQPWYNFSYCNLGFSLLANIISNQSGLDYIDYIAQNIFDPIGMSNSSVILNERVKENMSMGYFGRKEMHTLYIRDLAAGSLLSSVSDMALFMKMIFANGQYNSQEILKKETLELMFEKQNENVELDLDFGIGIAYWLENKLGIEEVKQLSHGGDLPPYHAYFMLLPEYKLGAVALSNANSSSEVVREIVVDILQKALEAKAKIKVPEVDNIAKEIIELTEDQLNEYQGYYSTPSGIVDFRKKNNIIMAKKSIIKVKLLPHKPDEFFIKINALGIPIAKDIAKKVSMSYHELDNMDLIAVYFYKTFVGYCQKIRPGKIPDSWQNRLGEYEIINSDFNTYSKIAKRFLPKNVVLKIHKKTGFLVMKMKAFGQTIELPLNPKNDENAIIYGIGKSMGETIRIVEKDGEEVLMFSGYQLKKVK